MNNNKKEVAGLMCSPIGSKMAITYDGKPMGMLTKMINALEWSIDARFRDILSNPDILNEVINKACEIAKKMKLEKIIISNRPGDLGQKFNEETWAKYGFIIGHAEDIPAKISTKYYQRDIE